MKPLSERLLIAQISSCNCITKTPKYEYHSSECLYRILSEASVEINKLRNTMKAIRKIIHTPQTLSGSDEPSMIAQRRMMEIYKLAGIALKKGNNNE